MKNYCSCFSMFPDRLTTLRTIIERPQVEFYQEVFYSYASDPLVTKYTTWLPHKTSNETKQFLEKCIQEWEKGIAYNAIVRSIESHKIIGMTKTVFENKTHAKIGYVIARSYWNKGFATEIVKGIIAYLFARTTVAYVSATCDVLHKASERVMQKFGMRCEGVIHRYVVHPSLSLSPRDVVKYGVSKMDWISSS